MNTFSVIIFFFKPDFITIGNCIEDTFMNTDLLLHNLSLYLSFFTKTDQHYEISFFSWITPTLYFSLFQVMSVNNKDEQPRKICIIFFNNPWVSGGSRPNRLVFWGPVNQHQTNELIRVQLISNPRGLTYFQVRRTIRPRD